MLVMVLVLALVLGLAGGGARRRHGGDVVRLKEESDATTMK